MTDPLYLLDGLRPDQAGVGAVLVLDGEEGHHAATVRRSRVGMRIDVADGAGLRARCVVAAVGKGRVELTVQQVRREPTPSPALVLVQALAKGGRDEQAVESATELGVDEVVPWQAGRSVVVWSGERGTRARAKWANTARTAAKQSRRAVVPTVAEALTTAGLVARTEAVVVAGGAVLLLDGDADRALTETALPDPAPGREVLVLVGPEGGIEPSEIERLREAGAQPVRLGPTVLRSSSAGPAALVVLAARLGRWG